MFQIQIDSGVMDAFAVGVEKRDHIDQLLQGTKRTLAASGYRTFTRVQAAALRRRAALVNS